MVVAQLHYLGILLMANMKTHLKCWNILSIKLRLQAPLQYQWQLIEKIKWVDFVEIKFHFRWKLYWMNLYNVNWIEISKLKWNELNILLFSFGFNKVNVLIEISIELNLVELNRIESYWIQIDWIHLNQCEFNFISIQAKLNSTKLWNFNFEKTHDILSFRMHVSRLVRVK
jgi:hypothetical protein